MRATTVGAAVPEARPVEAPPQAVETKNSRTTAIDERYTGSPSGSDMYYEIEGVYFEIALSSTGAAIAARVAEPSRSIASCT